MDQQGQTGTTPNETIRAGETSPKPKKEPPGRPKVPALPLIIGGVVFLLDQISKILVVRLIPPRTVGLALFNDFIRIIHVRNPGIAFSLGNTLPEFIRRPVFIVLPLLLLGAMVVYYVRSQDLSRLQRFALGGILGGGLGNIADRIFRPLGVVDFLDFKFFGLLGMERWPTFNLADSAVVVSTFLLIISLAIETRLRGREK
ncbi:MAG: signal peptidase II [Spirochaetales bacterium]|jgi:signal peptidase II|nr:signal peptidase II [Spirochaetales bacterium]